MYLPFFLLFNRDSIKSFQSGYWYTGTLADSEDPDEMPLNSVFHQGLNIMLR